MHLTSFNFFNYDYNDFFYIPTYLKFIPMVNVIVHFEILFAYNCIGGCFFIYSKATAK